MSTGPTSRRQFGPRHEGLERNLVRAVATGSVAFVAQDLLQQVVSEEERLKALREAAPREQEVVLKGQTDTLYLYESERKEKTSLALVGSRRIPLDKERPWAVHHLRRETE